MARSSEQRKNKKQTTQQPLERLPYNHCWGGQARQNENPGRAQHAYYVGKALEKKKDIVQYHPPRGKP